MLVSAGLGVEPSPRLSRTPVQHAMGNRIGFGGMSGNTAAIGLLKGLESDVAAERGGLCPVAPRFPQGKVQLRQIARDTAGSIQL